MRGSIVVLGICLAGSTAYADLSAVELQQRGEDLAKAQRYTEAIDAFKAADKLDVKASHACLIALAYARRTLYAPAEIWNSVCNARISPADPSPEWHAALEQEIADKVKSLAPITFVATATTRIVLDEFPDSPFGAATIHLAIGSHALVASAPGMVDAHRTIVVKDATPQHVAIELAAVAPPESSPKKTLIVAGAIVAGAGVVAYAVMGYEYLHLRDNKGFGGTTEKVYNVMRPTAIGLWAIGGGLVLVGALMHGSETAPVVAAMPLPGGGLVSVGWQR